MQYRCSFLVISECFATKLDLNGTLDTNSRIYLHSFPSILYFGLGNVFKIGAYFPYL